jgi:hypothetical protein
VTLSRFATAAVAAVTAALLFVSAGAAQAGASSPVPSPVPAGFQPASTSWLTARHGFVFGYAACSWSPSCEYLFDTTDGGSSWQQLIAPPITLPANSNHVQLTFATDKIGFATDGEYLYATHDGAAHWSTVSLTGLNPTNQINISSVTVFNGRVFAVGSSFGAADSTRIYAGAVDADTLTPVAALAPAAKAPAFDYGQLTAVGGVLQVAVGTSYQAEHYWLSRDGRTFTPAPLPCPVASSTPTLGGIQSGQVLVICAADPADPQPGQQTKQLLTAPGLGKPFTAATPLPTAGYQQDFATISANNATASAQAADMNLLYATFDGGHSWNTTLQVPDLLGLWDLAFPSATVGYLVAGLPQGPTGASKLYRSTDAGHSWAPLVVK